MASETITVDLDFVFLDSNGEPFRVRKFDGDYWICRKHPDKKWVTLRKVESFSELWHQQIACIEWKFHELYEFGIPFNGDGWPSHDAPRSGSDNAKEHVSFYLTADELNLCHQLPDVLVSIADFHDSKASMAAAMGYQDSTDHHAARAEELRTEAKRIEATW